MTTDHHGLGPKEESEWKLIHGLQRDAPEARETLQQEIERLGTPILRAGGVADAEARAELLHEAFLKSLPTIAKVGWRPGSSLAGFLSWRTRWVLFRWRKVQTRTRRERSSEFLDAEGSEEDPQAAAMRTDSSRAQRAQIERCRSRLGQLYRETWSYFYEVRLDITAIAERLGRTKGQVSTQLSRANAQMRQCLGAGTFEL